MKPYVPLLLICLLTGCTAQQATTGVGSASAPSAASPSAGASANTSSAVSAAPEETTSLIIPTGETLETRVLPPEGYTRTTADANSLATFLRTYALKEDGAPVLLYNGQEKNTQSDHIAVFKLPLESEDLQQCADSIMRVYAEYFWKTGQYDRISFKFVDGFQADYTKWRDGSRIQSTDNESYWVDDASYDDSYECFQKYMRIVFAYAGTLSLEEEATPVDISAMQVGDIFLKGGSPGHTVMIVDLCENSEGKKAFLLAQGYMPAQEFHLLKNPAQEDDPWYYVDEMSYPFRTPEYTFNEGSLCHLSY